MRIIARLNIGGPALHTVLLTAGLEAGRYETTLVVGAPGDGEGDMAYFATDHGVRPIVIPELGRAIRPTDDLVALWRLYRLMRTLRPTIVHTHTAKAGTLGRLAALAARVPVRVHTFHGHVFSGYFGRWSTLVVVAIERALARVTHRIVVISESQRREITERFQIAPGDRCAVVPLGLDLEPFRAVPSSPLDAAFRQEIGTGAGEVLVGIVGRLTAIKNHRFFLEAAAIVAEVVRVPVRFVVVGGGELERDLRAYAHELGIADRVVFVGWRRDLPDIYGACDVVALTSGNEGTPVAIIEALASGRPVVATDVGGVADVLEGGRFGLLVPPGDARAFARALAEMVEAPALRERCSAGARESARERFSVSTLVRSIDDLYTELRGERGADVDAGAGRS